MLFINGTFLKEFVSSFQETFFRQILIDHTAKYNFSLNSSLFNQQNKNATNLFESTTSNLMQVIIDFSDDQYINDSNLKIFIRFSEFLAHSTKFFICILFSFHLKILFKMPI